MSEDRRMISDEAVEAAISVFPWQAADYLDNDTVRAALEAAAPYMMAATEREAYNRGWGAGYRHTKAALDDPYRSQA